jgi:hypothetical protein
MTVLIQGTTQPVLSEGSRRSWAMPSLVHEGLGHRAIEPDRIQGDAVLSPHACITAQSRDHVMSLINARPTPRTRKPRAGFAAVKAATRRLRRWPAASPDCGSSRRAHSSRGRDEETLAVEPRNETKSLRLEKGNDMTR